MKLSDIFKQLTEANIVKKGGWSFIPSDNQGGDKLIFSTGDPAQLIEIGYDAKRAKIYGAVGGRVAYVNPDANGIKSLIVTATEPLPNMFVSNFLSGLQTTPLANPIPPQE